MNGRYVDMRIPKSWILLAVFVVSVIGVAAQHVFTEPPDGITNQTGSFFGNTSNDANNYTADRINVMNYFGVIVGTYLDPYSCIGSYCIYHPWYSSSQTFAKNMSTGNIDYSGTDANATINNAISTVNASSNKGKIVFRNGIYQPVSLQLQEGVYLEGEAPEKVILNYGTKLIGDGTNPVIFMSFNSSANINNDLTRGTGFSYFTLDGKGASNITYLPNADTFIIKNNRFNGTGWAVYIDYFGTLPPPAAALPGSGTPGIEGNTITSYKGIFCKYCTQTWITKNWFENPVATEWINLTSPIKVKVTENEFNTLASGCAINVADDQQLKADLFHGLKNQFAIGSSNFPYCFHFSNSSSNNIFVDDISETNAGISAPNVTTYAIIMNTTIMGNMTYNNGKSSSRLTVGNITISDAPSGSSTTITTANARNMIIGIGTNQQIKIQTTAGGNQLSVGIDNNATMWPAQKSTPPYLSEGGIYYDLTLHMLRYANSTKWVNVTPINGID